MNAVVGYREPASPSGGDRPGAAMITATTAAPTAVHRMGHQHRKNATINLIGTHTQAALKSAEEVRKRARTQQILR